MAATIYVIWSRKERRIVPNPDSNFQSSQAAQDAAKRLFAKNGDTKDKQNEIFDIVTMNI